MQKWSMLIKIDKLDVFNQWNIDNKSDINKEIKIWEILFFKKRIWFWSLFKYEKIS